ncbi:MAG: sigma-70 family RNA polymerase sigma factor [Lachnospiraceae bacterium]|nr:sigma-70 family RNA polymerase sigma factor [Lachnospiraceae bacterium]
MIENDELIYRRFLAERREEDFRILLDRHRESLILFLNGYVHNLEDAEELMLDSYAKIAAKTTVFLGRSSFKTWLFSIGKKMALMHLRKEKRRPDTLEYSSEPKGAVPPPEFQILRDEQNRELYLALSKLNAEYRQVLTLLYFEEMSHEELSAVMGRSRKQIYNLAERARKALKEELERMGFDYAQYR